MTHLHTPAADARRRARLTRLAQLSASVAIVAMVAACGGGGGGGGDGASPPPPAPTPPSPPPPSPPPPSPPPPSPPPPAPPPPAPPPPPPAPPPPSPPPPPPAPPPPPPSGFSAPQTDPGSTSYAGAALAAFTTLNAERTAAGLGVVRQASALDTAAVGHSNYLAINNNYGVPGSAQTTGTTGFTGATAAARLTAAGFSGQAYEVIAGPLFSGEDAVRASLATPYQRLGLLRHGLLETGLGMVEPGATQPPGTPSVTPNVFFSALVAQSGVRTGALPQDMLSSASGVSVFPRDGASDVPLIMFRDTPYPVAAEMGGDWGVNGRYPGYPISLQVTSDKTVTITSFTLTRVAPGASVPLLGKLLGPSDPFFHQPNGITNWATLVPLQALDAGATYEAGFTGSAGGTALTKTWRFTTRAGFTLGTVRRVSPSRVSIAIASPSGILGTAQIVGQTNCGADYVSSALVVQSGQTVTVFEGRAPTAGCVVKVRVSDVLVSGTADRDVPIN